MLIYDDANSKNVQISWIAKKYASVVLLKNVSRLASTETHFFLPMHIFDFFYGGFHLETLQHDLWKRFCRFNWTTVFGKKCGRCLKTLRRLSDVDHICSPMLKYFPTLISSAPSRNMVDA